MALPSPPHLWITGTSWFFLSEAQTVNTTREPRQRWGESCLYLCCLCPVAWGRSTAKLVSGPPSQPLCRSTWAVRHHLCNGGVSCVFHLSCAMSAVLTHSPLLRLGSPGSDLLPGPQRSCSKGGGWAFSLARKCQRASLRLQLPRGSTYYDLGGLLWLWGMGVRKQDGRAAAWLFATLSKKKQPLWEPLTYINLSMPATDFEKKLMIWHAWQSGSPCSHKLLFTYKLKQETQATFLAGFPTAYCQ